MPLTVLSDDQVNAVFEGLTPDELDEFRSVLSEALHEFSTNVRGPEDGFQQPHGVSTLHPETQVKTSYMSSCGPCGMGCKGKHLHYSLQTDMIVTFFSGIAFESRRRKGPTT